MPRSTAFLLPFFLGACASESSTPVQPPPPPSVPPEAVAWLRANAVQFSGTHLSLPHTDLAVLRGLIGDARVVALGENTHGTRDFFEMKARILRFLVEQMGFNAFLIEATWPESNRLDRYVRTGEGDSRTLLTGLYFWTWRTESVLEMIEWMRSHNAAGGGVGFYGFDMQYPGMALDNVIRYVADVDPARVPATRTRLDCLVRYANDAQGRFPTARYVDAGANFQRQCADSMRAEVTRMLASRATYVTASSVKEFELALQSLRVALQYHSMIVGEQSRDRSMAINTAWWVDHLGPHSKVVVWAHNFHVSTFPGAQGRWLRERFGNELVIVAFTHEFGDFMGVTQQGNTFTGLNRQTLDPVRTGSYEEYFGASSMPHFILDLRGRDLSSPATSWLLGPRWFRSIGCCFDPTRPDRYWAYVVLPEIFDAVIHIPQTRPTTILPAQYPTAF